ncbi:hypothetical protein BpHYR1_053452 [Brachionus plicatilis]|uniref:Uncharacterized protein n=1 Tax=Brachionus plicatilis TaxID=10195 RepID=A0A3M7PDQ6_BRAPC|nr:hypothetical protein BpHYR1_053452 [Brachionus plicatilis]
MERPLIVLKDIKSLKKIDIKESLSLEMLSLKPTCYVTNNGHFLCDQRLCDQIKSCNINCDHLGVPIFQ